MINNHLNPKLLYSPYKLPVTVCTHIWMRQLRYQSADLVSEGRVVSRKDDCTNMSQQSSAELGIIDITQTDPQGLQYGQSALQDLKWFECPFSTCSEGALHHAPTTQALMYCQSIAGVTIWHWFSHHSFIHLLFNQYSFTEYQLRDIYLELQ